MTGALLGIAACLQLAMSICCADWSHDAAGRHPPSHHGRPDQPGAPDLPAGCHATLGCAAHRRSEGEDS